MSCKVDSIQSHLLQSSLWGVARGIGVHTLIYPLEVIKIRQQCSSTAENSLRVALRLLQQEGFSAFYRGLSPQLLKTSIKQIWCWPVMTGTPSFLQHYGIRDVPCQILTGVFIAMIDATIATPLERAKILAASSGKTSYSLRSIYKEGWRGYTTFLAKLSVNWTIFLVAQKCLRDRERIHSEQVLSLRQLAKIGVQVAFIVSLVAAPFDLANTLKQAQNLSPTTLLCKGNLLQLYRGWPLHALSLVIHNVASVIVIENLSKK